MFVFHDEIPFDAMARLPGIQPVIDDDWLWVDPVFAGQMALRDDLIGRAGDRVHHMGADAMPAATELLQLVLAKLKQRADFALSDDHVVRPDGVSVPLDWDQPLITLGRLAQADYCILQKPEGAEEHVLDAAILCFPSSWRLDEKAGRPLGAIHVPVPEYDGDIARRVQRLFDGIQVGRPLWRANRLWHDDGQLFQPKSETDPRRTYGPDAAFLRSERQVLLRLPETRAVVFSIHTFLMRNPEAAGNGAGGAGAV